MGAKSETQGGVALTNEARMTECLGVIDKALSGIVTRELVSSGEITDVLLDMRTVLLPPAQLVTA